MDLERYNLGRYFQVPFMSKSEYRLMMGGGGSVSVRMPLFNMATTIQPYFGVGACQCVGQFFTYCMIGAFSLSIIISILFFIKTILIFHKSLTGTFITALMESFNIELYKTPKDAGGKHKMVITPLLSTHELVSHVVMHLRRRDISF
jgi:hypothetical protein